MRYIPKQLHWLSTVLLVIGCLYHTGFSFTCPGDEAKNTDKTGNYMLGLPLGGIGAGNFNFQADGKYNRDYVRVAADNAASPSCIVFQKHNGKVFSSDLQHGDGMATTFTGYWPTAKLNYAKSEMTDSVELECFSPISTGDSKNASLPLCYYIFTIKNPSSTTDTVAIALSNGAESIVKSGDKVIGIKNNNVCVLVDPTGVDLVTCGKDRSDFVDDGQLGGSAGGILAARVAVPANSTKKITFAVAWTNIGDGYYRKYFTDAEKIASYGIDSAVTLKAKVDNWHNKILNSNIPEWLKDLTINCLHVYNSSTEWKTSSGYGMVEAMDIGTPDGNFLGTNDQAFHSSFALGLFAPDAEWSQVQRMAGSQRGDGNFQHFYNGNDNTRCDVGQKFILEIYRTYQQTGDKTQLEKFYGDICKAIDFIKHEDRNNDGITDDDDMTTYDNPHGVGECPRWEAGSKEYTNEIYLGALKAAAKIAVVLGKPDDSTKFAGYFKTTSTSFEKNNPSGFWDSTRQSHSGHLGYYTGQINGNDKSQAVWDGGLVGQWGADVCGLGPLHPEYRIQSMLKMINDACLDQRNPPSYALMMAFPNVNCTGDGPQGDYFGCTCVTYGAYPAGDLCAGFAHNSADISMRALHSFWNITFSKFKRVYNVPCKFNANGNGTDWGMIRYMNPPGCFSAVFGITGFTIDINAKVLRLKPSLPSSPQYKMDSLVNGPLINPISNGTLDFKQTSDIQTMMVKFDNPMQFKYLYVRKSGQKSVAITKGSTKVDAMVSINTEDTSEYLVTFATPLTIDNNGVKIVVGAAPSAVNPLGKGQNAVKFSAVQDGNTISFSYQLDRTAKSSITLVNIQGKSIPVQIGKNGISGKVSYSWKGEPAGIYFAKLSSGDLCLTQKIVKIQNCK